MEAYFNVPGPAKVAETAKNQIYKASFQQERTSSQ